LEKLSELEHTLVFYESPHRIEKTITDALAILGNRSACLAREISKLHEEFIRGNLSEIKELIADRKIKGELVLTIEGFGRKRKKVANDR
jgi:16S rRNA (cytidine1402-2'-O)-methyltransferase